MNHTAHTTYQRITLIALFLLPLTASAQTIQSVPAGLPLKYETTHDGFMTNVYQTLVDGVKVGGDVPKSALVNGTLTVDVPPQAAGSHTIQMVAVSLLGQTATSTPMPFTATSGPNGNFGQGSFKWTGNATITITGTGAFQPAP
jgi:hypothetical protein